MYFGEYKLKITEDAIVFRNVHKGFMMRVLCHIRDVMLVHFLHLISPVEINNHCKVQWSEHKNLQKKTSLTHIDSLPIFTQFKYHFLFFLFSNYPVDSEVCRKFFPSSNSNTYKTFELSFLELRCTSAVSSLIHEEWVHKPPV